MKHMEKLLLPLPPEQAREICLRALQEQEWEVRDADALYLKGVRHRIWYGDFDFSLTLKVLKRGTGLTIKVDNYAESSGWDPLGVLRKPVESLCEAILKLTDHHLLAYAEERLLHGDPAVAAVAPTASGGVFISYSNGDSRFANKLAADLRMHGVEVWVDKERLRVGVDWLDKVAKAISDSRAVLLIVSPGAFTSKWVKKELTFANEINKDVLPVLYKKSAFPEWFVLRFGGIHRADFSQGNYRENLADLVKAIRETLDEQV